LGALWSRRPLSSRERYGIGDLDQAAEWQHQPPSALDLAFPPGANPQLETLAQRWRQESPNPEALVNQARQWFISQGFRYTLEPGILGGSAPLDRFLFEQQRGFCEHYAASFAALMRAAGVPARVVVGYQGGRWQTPLTGPPYLRIEQRDAHAWSEVWIEGMGWVSVDPSLWVSGGAGTAAEPVVVGGQDPFHWLERQWWGLDLAWTRWWLGFDARSQEALLARLLGDRRDALGLILLGAVVLTLAGGLALLGWLRQRGVGDPQRRELDRCLMAFARQGWLPRAGETLPQLAARLRARWPQLEPELGTFVARYEAQRFGPDTLRPGVPALRRSRRQLLRRWRQLT
jgi:hypothetical protein